jgi:HK97 family phage prohead protease
MKNRLSPAFEFKLASDPLATGEFRGYASTFNGPPDSFGDIIAPGAFAQTLSEHKTRGSMPALLWSHDPSEPIGKWLSLAEDRHGLAAHGKLTLGTKKGAEAHALLKDGALSLSIGFVPTAREFRGEVRVLKAVKLFEASLVALPANPKATVTAVRSALSRPTDIRSFEAALRELGFSVRESRKLALSGWRGLESRSDPDHSDIVAAIKRAAQSFNV